jgi:hypothetical protein
MPRVRVRAILDQAVIKSSVLVGGTWPNVVENLVETKEIHIIYS